MGAVDRDDADMGALRGQAGNATQTGAGASVAQPDAPRLRIVGAQDPPAAAAPTSSVPFAAPRPPTTTTDAEAAQASEAEVIDADPDEGAEDAPSFASSVPTRRAGQGAAVAPSLPSAASSASRAASATAAVSARSGSSAPQPTATLAPVADRTGTWSPSFVRVVLQQPPTVMVAAQRPSKAAAAAYARQDAADGAIVEPPASASTRHVVRKPAKPNTSFAPTPRAKSTSPNATAKASPDAVSKPSIDPETEPPPEPLEDPVERLARIMGWTSAAPSAAQDEGVAAVRAIVLPDAFNPDRQPGVRMRATPLGAYLADADATVEAAWLAIPVDPARATLARTVTLAFDIERSGKVTGIAILRPSGDDDLDLIALSAVPKRFKRVPKAIDGDRLHHALTLRYLPTDAGVPSP
jgi:TonB family protein